MLWYKRALLESIAFAVFAFLAMVGIAAWGPVPEGIEPSEFHRGLGGLSVNISLVGAAAIFLFRFHRKPAEEQKPRDLHRARLEKRGLWPPADAKPDNPDRTNP